MAWVRKCMPVVLNQTKNGLPAVCWRLMKSTAPARVSSSIVSIRFFVRGPVLSIFWVPSGLAQVWSTPRGPYFCRKPGKSFSVG